MQKAIRYDDDVVSVRFGRERTNKHIVELPHGDCIVAPGLYCFEEFACESFNCFSTFRKLLSACSSPGNPDAVGMRLTEHIFQGHFVGAGGGIDCLWRRLVIQPS